MNCSKFKIRCVLLLNYLISCSNGDDIQNINGELIYFPKCCESLSQVWSPGCYDLKYDIPIRNYFSRNNKSLISLRKGSQIVFKMQAPLCDEPIIFSDIFEFVSNGSVILQDGSIIKFPNYCIDSSQNESIIFSCEDEETLIVPKYESKVAYFSCVISSTVCYLFTVIVYKFILNVQEIHKKCFTGYCLCMGAKFICLSLFQKIGTNCNYLGSFFFLFCLASYTWLLCLCLDVVYLIRNFGKNENQHRIILYTGISVIIPLTIFLISIIPSGIPDVPISFIKHALSCTFKEGARPNILIIPLGVMLVACIGALFYCWYQIKRNDKLFNTDILWLETCDKLKYMAKSYSLLVLMSSISVVAAANIDQRFGSDMVYEIIKSLQGIFVVAIFVFNRYTRKAIRQAMFNNTEKTSERHPSGFGILISKFTSGKKDEVNGAAVEQINNT